MEQSNVKNSHHKIANQIANHHIWPEVKEDNFGQKIQPFTSKKCAIINRKMTRLVPFTYFNTIWPPSLSQFGKLLLWHLLRCRCMHLNSGWAEWSTWIFFSPDKDCWRGLGKPILWKLEKTQHLSNLWWDHERLMKTSLVFHTNTRSSKQISFLFPSLKYVISKNLPCQNIVTWP